MVVSPPQKVILDGTMNQGLREGRGRYPTWRLALPITLSALNSTEYTPYAMWLSALGSDVNTDKFDKTQPPTESAVWYLQVQWLCRPITVSTVHRVNNDQRGQTLQHQSGIAVTTSPLTTSCSYATTARPITAAGGRVCGASSANEYQRSADWPTDRVDTAMTHLKGSVNVS